MRAFGYSSAHVQVFRARPLKYEPDALGRIVRVSDSQGPVYEIAYGDNAPRPHPKIPGLVAYRFASLTVYRGPKGGGPDRQTIENKGYTFVRKRSLASERGAAPEAPRFGFHDHDQRDERIARGPSVEAASHRLQDDWEGWIERGEQARETYEEWNERRQWADRFLNPRPGSIDELEDREHLQEGIEAATSGDTADRLGWIAETHQRANEGLLGAIDTLDRLPTESTVDFEPAPNGGLPAGAGSQGLAISSRGAPRR
jgi:hypothetical protein